MANYRKYLGEAKKVGNNLKEAKKLRKIMEKGFKSYLFWLDVSLDNGLLDGQDYDEMTRWLSMSEENFRNVADQTETLFK